MNNYRAVFSSSGVCTRIPDAQTLFGAFCQAVLMTDGQDCLYDYLNSFNSEPWFVHSSMFPAGLFPAFKQPLLTLQSIQKSVNARDRSCKLDILAQLKKYKKFEYITESIFSDFVIPDRIDEIRTHLVMNGGTIDTDQSRGVSVLQKTDEEKNENFLMKSLLQTRSGTLENKLEKDLFYQKQLFFSEDSRFVIYIKANIEPERLKRILRMIEWTGTGPSSSIGFNQFHFEKIEKMDSIHKEQGNRICLLSACIPEENEFDLKSSDYGIESSLYKTSYSYIKDACSGRFNLLQPGSMMLPLEKKEYYGNVLKVSTKGKPVYHYGIGFSL